MVLELFIGIRPTDVIFKDGLNIHEYVAMALPKHVMEIAEPSLLMAHELHSRNEDKEKESEEKAVPQNDKYRSKLSENNTIEDCLVPIHDIRTYFFGMRGKNIVSNRHYIVYLS